MPTSSRADHEDNTQGPAPTLAAFVKKLGAAVKLPNGALATIGASQPPRPRGGPCPSTPWSPSWPHGPAWPSSPKPAVGCSRRWRGQGRHDLKDTLASLNLVLPTVDWGWTQRLFTIGITPLSFAAL